jgi:hypothetical protein
MSPSASAAAGTPSTTPPSQSEIWRVASSFSSGLYLGRRLVPASQEGQDLLGV